MVSGLFSVLIICVIAFPVLSFSSFLWSLISDLVSF